MKDECKTKKQLISELQALHRQIGKSDEKGTKRRKKETALTRATGDWENIFQAIGHPTLILDPDHTVTATNRAAVKAIGLSEKKIIGKKCYKIFHNTDSPPEGCPLEKMLNSRKLETFEMEIEALGGIYFVSCTPVFDKKGHLQKIIHIATDVTDRRKTEEALRQQKNLAQYYLDIAGVILVVIDANQRVSLINKKGCEVLGYRESEIIGKNWFDTSIPERARDNIRKIFNKLLVGEIEQIEFFENTVLTKKGEERIIAWHNTVLKDEKGNITSTLSSGEDITDRKKADESLKESEQRFKTIFDNASDGILLAEIENKYFHLGNKTIADMLGYGEDEINKLGVMDIHPEEDIPYVIEQFEKQARGEIKLAKNIPIKRKDGGVFYCDINAFPVTLGGKSYIVGIFRDITEKKRTEDAVRSSESFLNSIIEQSPFSMWVSDAQGTLIRLNHACRDLLHIKDEDVVGKYNVLQDNIVEEQGLLPLVKKVFENGDTVRFMLSYDSSQLKSLALSSTVSLILDVTIFPIKDTLGRISNAVIQHIDITEREKALDARRQSEEQLKTRVQELENFYEMGIGRELRMIELKKDVERLKEELGRYKKDNPENK